MAVKGAGGSSRHEYGECYEHVLNDGEWAAPKNGGLRVNLWWVIIHLWWAHFEADRIHCFLNNDQIKRSFTGR